MKKRFEAFLKLHRWILSERSPRREDKFVSARNELLETLRAVQETKYLLLFM